MPGGPPLTFCGRVASLWPGAKLLILCRSLSASDGPWACTDRFASRLAPTKCTLGSAFGKPLVRRQAAGLLWELACKRWAGRSNPDSIPMRVGANSVGQASPDGITDDIPRKRTQILFTSNSAIMEPLLPKPGANRLGARRLHTLNATRQTVDLTQLHQPMKMIRHHHISQSLGPRGQTLRLESSDQLSRCGEIHKHRTSLRRHSSHQIDEARLRIPPIS